VAAPPVVKQEVKKATVPTTTPPPAPVYISNKPLVVDEKYKKRCGTLRAKYVTPL
jgi:hypothetical protein